MQHDRHSARMYFQTGGLCRVCRTGVMIRSPWIPSGYRTCDHCDVFIRDGVVEMAMSQVIDHYERKDPQRAVGDAKRAFFNYAINYLNHATDVDHPYLLDIGCGFGHFLNHAKKAGWLMAGVEILPSARDYIRREIGHEAVIATSIHDSRFTPEMFDAITLWDVLAVIDEPRQMIKRCHQLLKKDGVIGIRTRNASIHRAIWLLYQPIQHLVPRLRRARIYVLNDNNFAPVSLVRLLETTGFRNIAVSNSPMTYGDPYKLGKTPGPVILAKRVIETLASGIGRISAGRYLVSPSIIAWGRK